MSLRIGSSVFLAFLLLKFTVAVVAKKADNEDDRASSSGRDSYLKAYAMTKKLNDKSDFNGFYPQDTNGYHDNGGFDYYGPPKPIYGPPKPVYGAPGPYPNYGPYPPAPPQGHYGPPEPFIPHALLGILDKIKYKIDLLTIGKIILKLVIFKKIVAWIGIICLLLFLPSLKKKHFFLNNNNNIGGGDEDLLRSYNTKNSDVDERINNLADFVLESIGVSSRKYNESDCTSFYCKSRRFGEFLQQKLTYRKLVELYSKEL